MLNLFSFSFFGMVAEDSKNWDWNCVWKMSVIPRAFMFYWLVAHEILPINID